MKNKTIVQLNSIIQQYLEGEYNESDFHSALEGLIQMITEFDLIEVREFLVSIDAELERIDFLVNKQNRPIEYKAIVKKIRAFIV